MKRRKIRHLFENPTKTPFKYSRTGVQDTAGYELSEQQLVLIPQVILKQISEEAEVQMQFGNSSANQELFSYPIVVEFGTVREVLTIVSTAGKKELTRR
jgi:hypothetical protein